MSHRKWEYRSVAAMLCWGFASLSQAQSLGLYLSPPGEQNTTRTGAIVESFDNTSANLGASGTLAMGSYTTSSSRAARPAADQYGGAGGIGRYLAVKGDVITMTLTGDQKYLGFWWSAGDATNNIKFYDRNNNLLASFTTSTLMTFLDRTTAPSWVTAIDGNQYPKASYYGNPNPPKNRNSGEAYAYMNLILEGTPLLFGKVEISGSNFELDNFAVVRNLDVSPTWVDLNKIPLEPTAPGIGTNDQKIYTMVDTAIPEDLSSHSKSTPGDTYSISTPPSNGAITSFDPTTGAYTYTPNPGFVGEDSFVYQLCQGSTTSCATAKVTIVVAPQANNDEFFTRTNTDVAGQLTTNDYVPTTATFRTSNVTGGSVSSISNDGSFTFTPNAGFNGTASFDYTVCLLPPNETKCDTATATIHVAPASPPEVTSPPVITGTPYVDEPVSGNYRYHGPDGTPEGETSVQWLTSTSNDISTASPVADGLGYTPPASDKDKYLFLCVTPTNTDALSGTQSCSAGKVILGSRTAVAAHAIPSLGTWAQSLLAITLLMFGGRLLRQRWLRG